MAQEEINDEGSGRQFAVACVLLQSQQHYGGQGALPEAPRQLHEGVPPGTPPAEGAGTRVAVASALDGFDRLEKVFIEPLAVHTYFHSPAVFTSVAQALECDGRRLPLEVAAVLFGDVELHANYTTTANGPDHVVPGLTVLTRNAEADPVLIELSQEGLVEPGVVIRHGLLSRRGIETLREDGHRIITPHIVH